jgi:hypothetical protein
MRAILERLRGSRGEDGAYLDTYLVASNRSDAGYAYHRELG